MREIRVARMPDNENYNCLLSFIDFLDRSVCELSLSLRKFTH